MPDPSAIVAWVELVKSLGLGFTVAGLLFVWGLYKGHIVWGWQYRAKERTEERWQHAALSGTGVLEKLTAVVERIEQRRG